MDRAPEIGETVEFNHHADGWVRAKVVLVPKWVETPDGNLALTATRPESACILEYLGSRYRAEIADLRQVRP